MKREELYNLLNTILPTDSIVQIGGKINDNCVILSKSSDLPRMSNSYGGWDNWYIDIYSPKSPLELDKLTKIINDTFKNINGVEIDSHTTGESWDYKLHAFSTTMAIRCPRTY